MRLLVCGGAGFIGSNFCRVRTRDHGDDVVVLDKLTYAGRRENLQDVEHTFVHGAIEDPDAVGGAMDGVDAVVNFAAETHVDRSIAEPDAFVRTHSTGTYVLLEEARKRGVRYLQVSTDEVYGSIEEGSFTEQSPPRPLLAVQRHEGRRRPARVVVLPHVRHRDADLPRLEQLRARTSTPRSSSR
jgi:dTDP-glucose 4,6-dehydratase